MTGWRITIGDGQRCSCRAGDLEATLRAMRGQHGVDEFSVEADSEDPGVYVPELADREVPDTIPEEWNAAP